MKIKELERFGTLRESSFKELTTLKVGGVVKYLFEPYSIEDLMNAIEVLSQENIDYKVIGFGSNLLCSDEVYEGVVIKLTHINKYHLDGASLYAEAGVSMIAVANYTIKEGLAGLDFACGIPASVGGCIFMNAGAYKESIGTSLDKVLVLKEHKIIWMDKSTLNLSYRSTIFKNNPDWIILAAQFTLKKADKESLISRRNERTQRRLNTQPLGEANCGSVFKNEQHYNAWQVVDNLRFRGLKVGGAKISPKHTNFIINVDNAKAKDINDIIEKVIVEAKEKHGIDMQLEVERFNWPIRNMMP